MLAVLDTSVAVSAIGWAGEAHRVLVLLARRRFNSVRSPYLTKEWTETITDLSTEPGWTNRNWLNWLEWLKSRCHYVDDPVAREVMRRDRKDNPILALAISERAQYLVSYDHHFLELGKPYGVQCTQPADFIRIVLAKT